MPGSPALSASSRSMHSSDRTSPTISRLGRIRRLSLTSSRSVISPVPSSPAWRVCIGTQSGCGNRSSKTSSTLTTRSPPGIAADKQFRRVVLPACVPPATRMLRPARTDASRKRAARGGIDPSSTRPCRLAARSTNLRMLTAEKPRLMPSSTTWSRWPSGSIASTNGREMSIRRPLDFSIRSTSSCTCAGGEHQVGQLVAAVAGDEHPARVVDPDLLHGRVVEVGLQRPEPGDPGDQLAHHRVDVGDRQHRPGQRALVVVAYDALGDPAHERGVALRVDPLAADLVAHPRVERSRRALRERRSPTSGPPSRVRLPPNLGVFTRGIERRPESVENWCDDARSV